MNIVNSKWSCFSNAAEVLRFHFWEPKKAEKSEVVSCRLDMSGKSDNQREVPRAGLEPARSLHPEGF